LSKGIACGGNWIVDHVKQIDTYPAETTLANISVESINGGGCAFNVIMNLAKFDTELTLYAYGLVGNDTAGEFLISECTKYPSIDARGLKRIPNEKTSYTDVYNVSSTGLRTFFHYRGANKYFSPENIIVDPAPQIFHLGYLLLLDGMDCNDAGCGTAAAGFLKGLKSRNIKTSIDIVSEDSSRFGDIVPHALRYTDYCIINDFEAEKLTGITIRSGDKISSSKLSLIGKSIINMGVNELVILHFPEGAYLSSAKGYEIYQPSLDIPSGYIKGSVGAGDSFCAGVLYGLYNKWDMKSMMEFASCAGAKNLGDLTSTGGMTGWKEILEMKDTFEFKKDVFI
jgi:sugar/nucleoside kinase (ribokinase family)